MANIAVPHTFSPGLAKSAEVNANFTEIQSKFNTYAVQTDVAKTITAAHTFAANILFTDNLYDIGQSAASRPRHIFAAGNVTVGGDLILTNAVRTATSDGADNAGIEITSAGALGDNRGANVRLFGNEHGVNPGKLILAAGDVGTMNFRAGGTERALLGSTGWQAIQFAATQVPNADVNTFDDYEEGTFTPGISFGGGTTGITYNIQSGSYTKIGNRVFFNLHLRLTAKGSSVGAALVTGLPFVSAGSDPGYSAIAIRGSVVTYVGMLQGFVNNTSTEMILEQQTEAGVQSQITDANFANNSSLIIAGQYRV